MNFSNDKVSYRCPFCGSGQALAARSEYELFGSAIWACSSCRSVQCEGCDRPAVSVGWGTYYEPGAGVGYAPCCARHRGAYLRRRSSWKPANWVDADVFLGNAVWHTPLWLKPHVQAGTRGLLDQFLAAEDAMTPEQRVELSRQLAAASAKAQGPPGP